MPNLMKFPRVYTKSDFGITSDITAQPSKYNKIGELTVPAGQFVTFGVGAVANGVDSREVAYIDLKDGTGTNIDGTIRLVLADPNEVRKIVVAEQRTERLRASATDRTQGFLLGEFKTKAKEDSKLIIEFYPDSSSAVTISATNSSVQLPVTVYQ
jgi:hypothetical protein